MNLTHRKEYLFRYVFLTCYSSIENEVIRKILDLFIFFLQKDVKCTKRRIKPKPTNKTKLSEH